MKPGVNLWSRVLIYNRPTRERERESERERPRVKTVVTQFSVLTVQWVVLKQYDDVIVGNWVTTVQTRWVELRLVVNSSHICGATPLDNSKLVAVVVNLVHAYGVVGVNWVLINNYKIIRPTKCYYVYRNLAQLILVTVIVIARTIFIVVSLWHSHCQSSPSSFDECSTALGSRRPLDQVSGLEPQVCISPRACMIYHVGYIISIRRWSQCDFKRNVALRYVTLCCNYSPNLKQGLARFIFCRT